ncbi:hypothetical protein [Nocardia sp. AB354]|uniref:hypothetical protein n=1 Tax=Nocardia sp. AB354 TaxID=3413283 RepID=UPI003C22A1EF
MVEQEDSAVRLPAAKATMRWTMTASVSVRNYRAAVHLWSARRSARESRAIEADLVGTQQPSIELQAVATNSVLLSVAFMEATINEILQDIADSKPGELNRRCAGIDEDTAALLRELWKRPLERSAVLDKYQVALTAGRKPPLHMGSNPYQAASKLVSLRNSLIHFKPEWQTDEDDLSHYQEKSLRGLFADSAIFTGPVAPWFPTACLASGCAEWAHKSATDFVDRWWAAMGLTRDYHDDLRGMPAP